VPQPLAYQYRLTQGEALPTEPGQPPIPPQDRAVEENASG